MSTLATDICDFLFHLQLPFKLFEKIELLDVHKDAAVQNSCIRFYNKFYNDNSKRIMLIGINPGRFGGGVTGIPFTDPIRLQDKCDIENAFAKKQELSSVFMYEMIDALGGPHIFYKQFYFTSVSPLGFVRAGKNLNYYDDASLKKKIEPFVKHCMEQQIAFGMHTHICFCIGEGENYKYMQWLNEKYKWFNEVGSLPHPRFIMQYKLKKKQEYIQLYKDKLTAALHAE